MEYLNKPNPVALVTHANSPTSNYRAPYPNAQDTEAFDNSDSDGSLLEYWQILRRNRRTIIVASLVGLFLGLLAGVPMKRVYRAKTSIEVLTLNENFMNMKEANPTTSNDNNYDTSEEETQGKLLQSRALLDRVCAKLGFHLANPAGAQASQSFWSQLSYFEKPTPDEERNTLITNAVDSLKIKPTPRTRVLEITIDSTDPKLAMDFANMLTREFMNQSMEARWEATQSTSQWLHRELDDARGRLRQSEDALQGYASGSGLIFANETNVATEKLQQLQESLSNATADRIAKQSRYELTRTAPPDSLGDVLADTTLRETASKINDLKRQIADVGAVYSSEYSKVRRLQAELDSFQPEFIRQRSDILARIKNDFVESSRKEKLLTAAYNEQAREVTGQDEKAIQYNILKREVDSSRLLYDTMLQQMKQASIALAMRANNLRIVDPAILPYEAVSPDFRLNAGIGMLLAIVSSICFVTMRERADRTLQQPGDLKLWANLPELGTIPKAKADDRNQAYQISAEGWPLRPAIKTLNSIRRGFATSRPTEAVELVTSLKKASLVAEAFRSALTSILFVGENGFLRENDRARVLVFTSPNAADGKTTVASNIAIAASQIRYKVLVIDADLRRPRMHLLFGLSNDRGLVDLLDSDLQKVDISNFVQDTRIANVAVLPAGPPTNAAAHLLYSPNLIPILALARARYDMIIIDTPPMLQVTDARVIGRLADGVVLVARAGGTSRDSILAAKERLDEDGICVLGSILNGWDPSKGNIHYYGKGHQYQSYPSNGYDARTKGASAGADS